MTTWAEHLLSYYRDLQPPAELPERIEWLFPQKEPAVLKTVEQFLRKYYEDRQPRTLMLGINPGRFGAGVTGVNFTAPRQLTDPCGIDHSFKDRSELSAEFIYDMIGAFGGVHPFYSRFFIGSVCPLGFVRDGKNCNYYDDPLLLQTVEPFILQSMEKLLAAPVDRKTCFAIGGEKNFGYLSRLNQRFGWFETLVPLPHPRFIMQYRRKQKEQFISQYLQFITK